MDKNSSTKPFAAGPAPRIIKPISGAEASEKSSESQNADNSVAATPERPTGNQVNSANSSLAPTNAAPEPFQQAAEAQNSEHARSPEHDALLAVTRKIQERHWQSVRPLLEDLQQKTWQLMDTAAGGFAREIEERVSYQTTMALENLDIEANARLTANLDRALARIVQCQRDAEQSLGALVTDSQKEVNQLSSRTMQNLQEGEARVQSDLQKQAQSKLDELKTTGTEVTGELRRSSEALAAELKTRTDQMIRDFESRMQAAAEEAMAKAQQRVTELARDAARVVEKQAKTIVDRQISGVFIQALRTRLGQLERAFTDENGDTGEVDSKHRLDSERSPEPGAAAGPMVAPASRTPSPSVVNDVPINLDKPFVEKRGARSPEPRLSAGEELYALRQARFRQRFVSLYGTDRSYTEYEPAYRFGCNLANNPKYTGKDWRSIEKDVKQDWEKQGIGQWEKFKGSIQYAWLDAFNPD